MKKSCKGCYAVEGNGHPLMCEPHGCALNYKNDGNGHPLEECPKPRSWRQLENETNRRG